MKALKTERRNRILLSRRRKRQPPRQQLLKPSPQSRYQSVRHQTVERATMRRRNTTPRMMKREAARGEAT